MSLTKGQFSNSEINSYSKNVGVYYRWQSAQPCLETRYTHSINTNIVLFLFLCLLNSFQIKKTMCWVEWKGKYGCVEE